MLDPRLKYLFGAILLQFYSFLRLIRKSGERARLDTSIQPSLVSPFGRGIYLFELTSRESSWPGVHRLC